MCVALHTHRAEVGQDERLRAVIVIGSDPAFCAGCGRRFALAATPLMPDDSFLALTSVHHDCYPCSDHHTQLPTNAVSVAALM